MKIIKLFPGIVLSVAIAALACWLESLLTIHLIGSAVIAMFIGMFLNQFVRKTDMFASGLKFTSKKILNFAIILQNPGYINNIESGKSMPSLSGIFYICEYLGITPSEFFDIDSKNPTRLNDVIKDLKRLNDKQLDTISALIKDIIKD